MTTKTAQFTPGPWSTERDRAKSISIYGGSTFIGEVYNEVDEPSLEEQANTNLIAAAPEMYEALKALHSVLDQRMPDGRTLNQHLSREVFECFYGPAIAARVAIAKAEGA